MNDICETHYNRVNIKSSNGTTQSFYLDKSSDPFWKNYAGIILSLTCIKGEGTIYGFCLKNRTHKSIPLFPVRIFRQSGIAAIYQPSLFFASSGKDKYDTCSAVFGFLIQPQKSKIRRKANAKVAKRTQL